MPTCRGRCYSTCAAHLSQPCRQKRCSSWQRTTLPTTTACSKSAELASTPATLLRLISIGWNCSASSMNRICKLPRRAWKTQRSNSSRCSTTELGLSSLTSPDRSISATSSCRVTSSGRLPLTRGQTLMPQPNPKTNPTEHKVRVANGSTDTTFGALYTHNSSNNNPFGINTLGVSVSLPLRIFDRNQGEKLRTQLDIDRTEKLTGAAQALVFSDVDSAYTVVNSNLILLQPYKTRYLQQAVRVGHTVA